MPGLLEIVNLVKKYKTLTAVDNISFSIPRGVCFGLLGPNGAGKTTTIEILEDVISPTSGEVFYKGKPRSASFREEVGIQFQKTELLSWLTIEETLKTFQSLYRTTSTVEEVIEMCQLNDIRAQYNDKVSGGQRQRLFLALALINDPDLLFLDEPSTGLDPQARHNLWDIILKIREQGKTIVLTTHYMEEAQKLCDDIAIMDHGKMIARGTPEYLIDTYCSDCVTDGLRAPNLEDVFIRMTGRGLRD
ncbi:MAG TPA: ABC transporter ATP-binding protein [Desulfobacteraceae bacterium]|nr:ABC transporter ATP-binding protein [Desulfobacteraceae bacterium]